jgi:hypothetical protein
VSVERPHFGIGGEQAFKYRISYDFAIYYSKAERDAGAQQIASQSFSYSTNTLPDDFILDAYTRALAHGWTVIEQNV